ncbi:MAG TPA: hypothetical protein VHL09_03840 [Dehalococcoidia bacterium]|nr:hypothetical protein [Dehalococcoidia bacterium]
MSTPPPDAQPERTVTVRYYCGHVDDQFHIPESLSNRAAVLLPVVLREFPCRRCAGPDDEHLLDQPDDLLRQFDAYRQGQR